MNDDVEMQTAGWLQSFITTLKSQANVGVTGPTDPRRNLLTQAFVHRTHFQIFEPMYPVVFKNWYMDDWMELVYGKLTSPVSTVFAENSPHPPRYDIDTKGYIYLQEQLLNGCLAIQMFMKGNGHSQWDTFRCTKVKPEKIEENRSVILNPSRFSLSDPVPSPTEGVFAEFLDSRADADKTAMITFTNFGFLEMTLNWVLNVNLWKIKNYIVIALDKDVHENLLSRNIPSFYDENFSTSPDSADFLEGHYRELVNLKTIYNFRILSLGYNTLLCDNDIALLRNPFEVLNLDNKYDIQIQDDSASIDKFTAVNTGFQLVRSNTKTILFYKEVVSLTQSNPELQDQRAYNVVLQNTKFTHLLNWVVLDPLLFPNGWVYFISKLPQKENQQPVIVHNNWIRGLDSKIHRFREHHLWLIDPKEYYTNPEQRYLTYSNNDNHINSYYDQTMELYEAILLCRILKRTLIFPPIKSFEKNINETEPFFGIETLYDISKLKQVVELREHAFLTNPIHSTEEYSPLKNTELLDIIFPDESPCHENNQCFHPGHKGFIKLKAAKVITAKQALGLDNVYQLFENDVARKNRPVIVIPSLLGKFCELESYFSHDELEQIRNAVTLRAAPHLK